MPSLRIDVSESVARKLDTERNLLGFDSREAYLRWILDRRTNLDTDSDRDRMLSAYAERVEELEAKLDEGGTGDASAPASAPGDTDGRAAGASGDAAAGRTTDDAAAETGTGTAATENATLNAAAWDEPSASRSDADADSRRAGEDPDAGRDTDDGDVDHNLSPGEARIADDSVNELATELAGVEGERLDAFAREAVMRTGRELDGSPETGLSYRSDANLARTDADRPGEEITDLDELEVPGREEALVTRRRVAVGAALALLREREEALRSDFVDALYKEHPAGYETADSWWGCIKRGLRQVDRVRPAGEHRRVWEFHTTPGRVTRLPSRE